jgi:hypothetical protein
MSATASEEIVAPVSACTSPAGAGLACLTTRSGVAVGWPSNHLRKLVLVRDVVAEPGRLLLVQDVDAGQRLALGVEPDEALDAIREALPRSAQQPAHWLAAFRTPS